MTDTLDRSRKPLLALITEESLDRDYQVVASRRDPLGSESRGSRTAVVLVVAAFAMLVTVAAVQTSRNADLTEASRASLIERIESRRTLVGGLQEDVARLRRENADAENELRQTGARYSSTQARRSELAVLTGFTAVTGPGIRVTLDNAELADDTAQLRDSDLALLVNGLWSAGAEAISINGRRLTAVSAIRNSGPAIEVNSVGIAPPYTILAIGDRGSLSADFLDSGSGLAFVDLANRYGFRYDIDTASELRLPAAPASMRTLRSAEYDPDPPMGERGGGAP